MQTKTIYASWTSIWKVNKKRSRHGTYVCLNSRNDKISTTYNNLSWTTNIKYDSFNGEIRENKKIVEKTTFMPHINHMTNSHVWDPSKPAVLPSLWESCPANAGIHQDPPQSEEAFVPQAWNGNVPNCCLGWCALAGILISRILSLSSFRRTKQQLSESQ